VQLSSSKRKGNKEKGIGGNRKCEHSRERGGNQNGENCPVEREWVYVGSEKIRSRLRSLPDWTRYGVRDATSGWVGREGNGGFKEKRAKVASERYP